MMRDILYPDDPDRPKDAYTSARKGQARALPKRFYREATVAPHDGQYRILLDGKPALTPGRNPLQLARAEAAALLAAEWNAVTTQIDPAEMHATRIANVGIDRVAHVRGEVIDEIVRYAASDLLLLRATSPQELVAREDAVWNPVLTYIHDAYDASFVLSQGLHVVEQPPASLQKIHKAVEKIADSVALTGFHTMTTIAGSVLIALAVRGKALSAGQGFDAASLEEDWATQLWGEDQEASLRRARRKTEFLAAAALVLELS